MEKKSIKESAVTLPAGICFYEQSGLVSLVNTEMNDLCILSTGKALLNGKDFWLKISHGELEENCQSLQLPITSNGRQTNHQV